MSSFSTMRLEIPLKVHFGSFFFFFASSTLIRDDLNSPLWEGRLLEDVFTFIQLLIAVINRHRQT